MRRRIAGVWISLLVVVAAGASACSQTGDSGPGSPVTPTPMSAPTDTPVPTTPHSLNKTPMSESTPTDVPTDIPVPRPTESPTSTPTPEPPPTHTPLPTATMTPTNTPTSGPMPTQSRVRTATHALTSTPTVVPTPTPTPVPGSNPDAYYNNGTEPYFYREGGGRHTRLSGIIPWFANPPDATHANAGDVIVRIWLFDADLGDATARLIWVADGILPEELSPLGAILLISERYSELGKRLVEITWVADGVNDDEMGVLTVVVSYVRRWDSELATLLLESAWVADGIIPEDRITAATIDHISFFHREFGRRLISAPLVADGLNNDELTAVNWALYYIETRDLELATLLLASSWIADGITTEDRYTLETIDRISVSDREFGKLLAASSLAADGLNSDERKAVEGALSNIARTDVEHVIQLLASPWIADGITTEELYTLEVIDLISRNGSEVVKALADSKWIVDGSPTRETHLLDALGRISQHPDSYRQLTSQPWFIDGLNDEEAVLVIALGGAASRSPKLFYDLLTAHHTQHRTISLPLTGEANIWIIQNSPSSPDEDVLTLIEDHVRISEEFMEAPFPVADVILLHVDPHVGDYGLGGGWHSGSHFVAVRPHLWGAGARFP